MSITDKKIDALTQAIEKLLAREVAPIAPVAVVAPVAPVLPIVQQNNDDHNILLEFRAETITELRNIRIDIKNITDGTGATLTDHETRLRSIEKYAWIAIGGLYIINIALGIYLALKK